MLYNILIVFILYKTDLKNNEETEPMQKNKKALVKSERLKKYLLEDYQFLQDYIILEHSSEKQQYKSGISDTGINEAFIAQIMGTNQLVKFTKVQYSDSLMDRFEALADLYQQGVVLLDNIFILDEDSHLYFYIIEAYIPDPADTRLEGKGEIKSLKNSNLRYKYEHSSSTIKKLKTQPANIDDLSEIGWQQENSSRYTTLFNFINSKQYETVNILTKISLVNKLKILLDCVHQVGQPYLNLTSHQVIFDLENFCSIFLAPYQLSPSIHTLERKVVAYLSPEIIKAQKGNQAGQRRQIEQRVLQLQGEKLFKSDIWSFGCISLEVLLFCGPIFESVNNKQQMRQIHQFLQIGQKIKQKPYTITKCFQLIRKEMKKIDRCEAEQEFTLLQNLIRNALQYEPESRKLTSIRDEADLQKQRFSEDKKGQDNRITYQAENKQGWKKKQGNQVFNSELRLRFIHLRNITVERQMRINVNLGKKYSIFVSPIFHQNSLLPDPMQINKTVSIMCNYETLYQQLSKGLQIQLLEGSKSGRVQLDLSTMVFEFEGKRAWIKPLIGSYKCKDRGAYNNGVIKVEAQIVTSLEMFEFGKENLRIEGDIIKRRIKKKEKSKQKVVEINKGEDLIERCLSELNCFEKINKNLETICEKWKGPQPQKEERKEQKTIKEQKTMQKVVAKEKQNKKGSLSSLIASIFDQL